MNATALNYRETTLGEQKSAANDLLQVIHLSTGNHKKTQTFTFKKGDFVYLPSDVANSIFCVKKGRVKVGSYSDDGKEVIKTILGEGEWFGEASIWDETERFEFAQALEKVEVDMIPVELAKKVIAENPRFAFQILESVGKRMVKSENRLHTQIFKSAKSRIIKFLRDLAVERGKRVGFDTLVLNFFTHQEIASMTGTSRQTVTTILNELREANHIYFDRRKLLVRDIPTLSAMI